MELKSGILSFRLNTSLSLTQVDLWVGLSYCDGKWNKVIIKKKGSIISASMNELRKCLSQSRAQPLMVNSPVYVGGTPQELQDSFKHLSLEQGKVHLEFPNKYSSGPTRFQWFCVLRYSNRVRLEAIPTHPFFAALKKIRMFLQIVLYVALKTVPSHLFIISILILTCLQQI